MFLVIVGGMAALNLAFWLWADRRLRGMLAARVVLALFVLVQLFFLGGRLVVDRATFLAWQSGLPQWPGAAIYLWNVIVLPLSMAAVGVARLLRREKPVDVARRRFLALAATAAPPMLAGGLAALVVPRLHRFRIRRIDVPVPGLPDELDGATIAHVADVHAGKFVDDDMLADVARAVNGLDADLVCMPGDLIDLSLADLPRAIDMVRELHARSGVFLSEGNHDLIDDPEAFRERTRDAGLDLLVGEGATVEVRGRRVQLLGLPWTREEGIDGAVRGLPRVGRDGAFPILLAHHPHAFDAAAAAGVPLTLSGHTHGGLLMLSERVGPGPLLYRYWSGLYEKPEGSAVVSNGVGTWFPLRTHAPAEVVHLTLRRAV